MAKVCRLCLHKLQRGSKYFNVNAVESYTGFMPYRDQLTTCIPEIALDLVPHPVVCNSCRIALKTAYEFKNRCLTVEEKIREYVDSQPNVEDVDLTEIAVIRFETVNVTPNVSELVREIDVPESDESEHRVHVLCEPELVQVKVENNLEETADIICNSATAVDLEMMNNKNFKRGKRKETFPDFHKLFIHKLSRSEDFTCNFCNRSFKSLQYLRKHNSVCPNGNTRQKNVLREPELVEVKVENNVQEETADVICNATTAVALETLNNKKFKRGRRKVETFPDCHKLFIHKLSRSENFTCNFCNRSFKSLQYLRKHNSVCPNGNARQKAATIAKGGAVLVKRPHLPTKAKNHLKRWLFRHTDHPYPTDQEKQVLMKETNLSLLQVENWFINARRRILQDLTKLKSTKRYEELLELHRELDIGVNIDATSVPSISSVKNEIEDPLLNAKGYEELLKLHTELDIGDNIDAISVPSISSVKTEIEDR